MHLKGYYICTWYGIHLDIGIPSWPCKLLHDLHRQSVHYLKPKRSSNGYPTSVWWFIPSHYEVVYQPISSCQYRISKNDNPRNSPQIQPHSSWSHDAIKYTVAKGLILGIELDLTSKPEFCDACTKAKASCQPCPKISNTWAEQYGEIVFWDLWGPATIHSQSGNFYVAARTDDHTHEMKLYFLKTKDQTFKAYKWDEAYLKTHSENHIKWMHSNWGGEFLSKEMKNRQDTKGTLHELTVHDSPQQNGVAECGNWTWAERAHTIFISSHLPQFLWEEAMKHSTWLQSCTGLGQNNHNCHCSVCQCWGKASLGSTDHEIGFLMIAWSCVSKQKNGELCLLWKSRRKYSHNTECVTPSSTI